jgi:hypothetical protein
MADPPIVCVHFDIERARETRKAWTAFPVNSCSSVWDMSVFAVKWHTRTTIKMLPLLFINGPRGLCIEIPRHLLFKLSDHSTCLESQLGSGYLQQRPSFIELLTQPARHMVSSQSLILISILNSENSRITLKLRYSIIKMSPVRTSRADGIGNPPTVLSTFR